MTITQIYETATASYGRPFNPSQCDAWKRALQEFTAAEVQAALGEWQKNTVPDFDGRTLGSKLPQPSDIRAICLHNRELETRRNSGDFVPCNKCEEGWVRVFEGRTVKGNVIDEKAGAVRMCECRIDYLCAYFHCARAELPERLRKHREARAKRKSKNE